MPIKFDTLEHASRLEQAGIPKDQADAHAQAFFAALSDLTTNRADAEAHIEMLYAELNSMLDAQWTAINSTYAALLAKRYHGCDLSGRRLP